MIKEMLYLQDRMAMDFISGQILYEIKDITADKHIPVLPYTSAEIDAADNPKKFLDYIQSLTDTATAETLLYYLSLIPSGNTDFGYWAFFYGEGCTGKTTLCHLLEEIFVKLATRIPAECFFAAKKQKLKKLNPSLTFANEKLLSISDDATMENHLLNFDSLRTITNPTDKSTLFFYSRCPWIFEPSAQFIFSSNNLFAAEPKSLHNEEILTKLIIFPFEHHFSDWERKAEEAIISELRPEFPGIIKFLTKRYIHLRDELHGKIPMSEKCRAAKENFIKFNIGANK